MPTLAEAEERWRLTIDNAPTGIALMALDGRFVRVNQALCSMLGLSAEQLLELGFQDLTHPDDLGADLELREQLLAGEFPSYRTRKRCLHADGHALWADLSVALVRNGRGKPLHLVAHVFDRSEEVASAQRIEQINRDLSQQSARLARSNADLEAFAMLASHDLQAPLATVRGYLELLRTEYGEDLDDRAGDWLDRASRATERMSGLLSSLLEYSRAGDTQAAFEEVRVSDLVDELRQDLGQLIGADGAVVESDPDDPVVLAQRSPLRQVLQNLVQNSLKYRHPERTPRTVVRVQERPEDWLVTVADNAVGIPHEHQEAVFRMFARVDALTPGHGIGLAASRRIVERAGGSIWVEDNDDHGSLFCFTLPRQPLPTPPPTSP